MPIRAKQSWSFNNSVEVFDEWGAVMRHQDEIEKLEEEEDRKAYRERQMNYK